MNLVDTPCISEDGGIYIDVYQRSKEDEALMY
jgi:hypothetical protein